MNLRALIEKRYKESSRDDLIVKEQLEIDLINQFLPKQLNEREIEEILKKKIKKQNLSFLKDIGVLMNKLKSEHAGSVDMIKAGKIAQLLLNN